MTRRGRATALVGAQYGSEGKGLVAAALAHLYDVHVRTGGPNAGHTFHHDGEVYVARSIPCGWINPEATLYIGPGAVIDPGVFQLELDYIKRHGDPDVASRIVVDHRAVVVSYAQHMGEGGVHGRAHQEIGSTGEGVGLARMARINRDTLVSTDTAPFACIRVADVRKEFEAQGVQVDDAAAMLRRDIGNGCEVLLEGTQGSGLSLTLGPWPFCTSADTNAAQLASDAGISPSDVQETILVARTYPIRVAGNSGPLWHEVDWDAVGQKPEITTVTKKVRRVGHWNIEQVKEAAAVNHPALLVITFMDYLFPETAGVTDWRKLPQEAMEWLAAVEKETQRPVIGVGTGPKHCIIPLQQMPMRNAS